MFSRVAVALFAALLIAGPAHAQGDAAPAPPPAPVSGTVESLAGNDLTLKLADGASQTVTLADDVRISTSRIGTVADIKAGQFIGTTAVEGPDGKLVATEVHIFPEDMRGTGEGHYPWPPGAPAENTTMTNGNIETLEGVTDGSVIKVSYNGGETTVSIPPTVQVTVIETATREQLTPGTAVTVFMGPNAAGEMVGMGVGIAPTAPPAE